jgi:hypothetical protein
MSRLDHQNRTPPLPLVYAIKIKRFIASFLPTLPLALLHRMDGDWLVPLIRGGLPAHVTGSDLNCKPLRQGQLESSAHWRHLEHD